MLRSLTLHDWKSFGEGRNRVPLSPLTFLVGPNGSGKSNVIDALRFLQGVAFGYPYPDVLNGRSEGQRDVWLPIRGHSAEAARSGKRSFGMATTVDVPPLAHDIVRSVEHSIQIDVASGVELVAERLVEGQEMLPLVADGKSVRLLGTMAATITSTAAERGGSLLQNALRTMAFLEMNPEQMRQYRPMTTQFIGNGGENISPVLAAANRASLNDIVDWLSELCAPAIEDIEFDRTMLQEVMFFLVERGGHKVSARSVSDGTLRFLGLLTSLLTAPSGSVIVLEEPDVGLHPARIHLLVQLLEQVTADRNVQILATTHSPTLLAHLSPRSLADVVAMGRDPTSGTTVCARLGDLPHFGMFRDSHDLEHLVSTGWIEREL